MSSNGSALQAFVTFDLHDMIPKAGQTGFGGVAADPVSPALGNNADFVSPVHEFLPPPATVKNWYLRSYGRELIKKAGLVITNKKTGQSKAPRIRWCGSKIAPRCDGVGLYSRPDRPYGRVSGVCVCGQSLACPVCAPRVAAFRSAEVAEAFKRAAARGQEARLVTFTIPHTLASSLGQEIDCFASAWRSFSTGKRGVQRRAYSLGHHVGREVTFGKNGWHYHHHQLRYDEPGKFCEHTTRSQWLAALDSVGRKWRGAELHAFDAGLVGDEAGARYCAKLATSVEAAARSIGSEVASSATKGRNLATLLASAARGDTEAANAWLGGVQAITSRKVSSVRWSRGLRAELGLTAEKSDDEVAQEEVLETDVFLGALNPLQWRGILRNGAEFALCCAAQQGEEAVNSMLSGLGLGLLNDDVPARSCED